MKVTLPDQTRANDSEDCVVPSGCYIETFIFEGEGGLATFKVWPSVRNCQSGSSLMLGTGAPIQNTYTLVQFCWEPECP